MANIPPRMPVRNPAVSVDDLPEILRVFVLIKNRAIAEVNIEIPKIRRSVLMPLSVNHDNEIKPITKPTMLLTNIGFSNGPKEMRGDLLRYTKLLAMDRMHAILAASAIDMICKAPVNPTKIKPKANPVKF